MFFLTGGTRRGEGEDIQVNVFCSPIWFIFIILLFLLLLFFDAMHKNCLCSTTEGDSGQTRLSVFGNIYRETTTTTWCHTSKVKFCQKNSNSKQQLKTSNTIFFYFFLSFVSLTAFIYIRKLIQSKAERERKKE